jgi:cytochrome c biogenesis protein CcmG/thiol:disulfide interchange protein DsbE
MKIKLLCLTVTILTSALTFGQTKYILTNDGEIVDTVAYYKMKDSKIEKLKSILPSKDVKVLIKDNFKIVRQNQDSLIYSYKWDIKIGEPKVKETKSFEPDDYLDKEFPLPLLATLDNKKISIKDLKGKPTLINFWFTTCKPCIEEMPVLNGIKNQLKDSVNFIAITYEKTEKTKAFLKKHKFTFRQIANAEKFTNSMSMTAFPVNIFLDKNGIVRKIESGIPYVIDNNKNKNKKMKMGDGNEFLTVLRELL